MPVWGSTHRDLRFNPPWGKTDEVQYVSNTLGYQTCDVVPFVHCTISFVYFTSCHFSPGRISFHNAALLTMRKKPLFAFFTQPNVTLLHNSYSSSSSSLLTENYLPLYFTLIIIRVQLSLVGELLFLNLFIRGGVFCNAIDFREDLQSSKERDLS